jgi:acylphosphatase
MYSGRVQGVGFRATARHIAASHPVTGWVRNEHDGTVSLEVQGLPFAIEAFLNELRTTTGRFIRTENAIPVSPANGESNFRIEH